MALPRPSSRDAESDSRESLLLAARKLFASRGIDGATVRDLAREANTNLCMVSYHFGGKEGLYRACIERFGRERLVATESLLEPAKTAEDFRLRLFTVVHNLVEVQVSKPEMSRILANEMETGLPNSRDVFEETILVVFKRLVGFFAEAQRTKIIRADADPLYLTTMVYCTIGNLVRLDALTARYFRRSLSERKNRELLAKQITETIVFGTLAPGERK